MPGREYGYENYGKGRFESEGVEQCGKRGCATGCGQKARHGRTRRTLSARMASAWASGSGGSKAMAPRWGSGEGQLGSEWERLRKEGVL